MPETPQRRFTPESIRALRGARSRPRFAALLGVAANTVYRWELPETSAHHLSPSAAALRALERLASGVSAAAPAHSLGWAGSRLERGVVGPAYRALCDARYDAARELLDALEPSDPEDAALVAGLRARERLLGRGDAPGALQVLEGAKPQDPHGQALCALWEGMARSWPDGAHLDRPRALALLHGARDAMARLDERGGVFWAELGIGLAHFFGNALDEARRHLQAASLLDQVGARAAGQTWMKELLGHLARLENDYRRSQLRYGEALALARGSGDVYAHARALAFIAERRMEAGAPVDSVIEAGEAARAHLARLGHPLEPAHLTLLRALGESYVGTGRFLDLRTLLGPAVERLEKGGASPYTLRELLGRGALRAGELGEARRQLEALRALQGTVGRPFGLTLAEELEAAILLAEGDAAGSAAGWRRAREAAERFGSLPMCGDAGLGLCEALLACGEVDEAKRALTAAERDLAQVHAPVLLALLARARGMVLLAQGHAASGRAQLREAREGLARAGDLFEAERCDALLARGRDAPDDSGGPPSHAIEKIVAAVSGGEAAVLAALRDAIAAAVPASEPRLTSPDAPRGAGSIERAIFGSHAVDLAVRAPAWLRALLAVAELALSRSAPAEAAPISTNDPDAHELVVAGPETEALDKRISRLARARSTVLVLGESGVGKELVARALHRRSGRTGPLQVCNVAAIPAALFESQLFGHARGAFTGAERAAAGLIRAAHRGTLFLDEIGELPLECQPKLLRYLEEGEVQPVGADRPVRVDVRVIAATHRDLAEYVAAGRFRADLYYRLNVIPLAIPPLRERREEIPALVAALLARIAGSSAPTVSEEAMAALCAYDWPGNVRELRNELERALAFHGGARLELQMLGHAVTGDRPRS